MKEHRFSLLLLLIIYKAIIIFLFYATDYKIKMFFFATNYTNYHEFNL